MQVPRFEMERWQSVWEHHVALNISESGVRPMSVEELCPDPEDLRRLAALPLGYPPTNGSGDLRTHIAVQYPGACAENVLVTTGCAEANFLITWALVEPGDHVLFMQPNYMQVGGIARGFGARVDPLWLREELQWAPNLDDLRRLVTPRTRLIAICNPSNPTGATLSERAMDEICAAAAKVGAWILADEVYRGAEFEGSLAPTFWGRYDRVLCTGGLSKAYGLPGLRTGWVVGPREFVEKLWGYKDYTTIGLTMLTDRLAAAALAPAMRARILERTRRILRENYPVVQDWIAGHGSSLHHVPPRAGAIAWVRYAWNWKSADLAEAARTRKSVLVVPGSQFEMESYLRIGYGHDAEKLSRALRAIDELVSRAATT
jgi:aspartate/methionine/tyrosine aminotransferase